MPFPLILSLIFLSTVQSLGSSAISDKGKYFSPAMIEATQKQIDEIRGTFRINLRVDTYPKIEVEGPNTQVEQHFFDKQIHDWLETENKKTGPEGIHLLFIRDPGYVIVAIGTTLQRYEEISEHQRTALTRLIQKKFETADYDEGLRLGMEYILKTLRGNHSGKRILSQTEQRKTEESKWLPPIFNFISRWFLSIVCGLITLLFTVRLGQLLKRQWA